MSFLEKLKNISNVANKKCLDALECCVKEECESAARKQYKSVRILYGAYGPEDFKIIANKLGLQTFFIRTGCFSGCPKKVGRVCNCTSMGDPLPGGAVFYGW